MHRSSVITRTRPSTSTSKDGGDANQRGSALMDWTNDQTPSERYRGGRQAHAAPVIFDHELLEQKDYWLGLLSHETGEANLRLDYPRPTRVSAQMEAVQIVFTDALNERIADVTRGAA